MLMLITDIGAARKMVLEAALRLDENADVNRKAYLGVNLAGYRLHMMANRAVQALGGYGIIRLSPD
jgi:alkylation response protein AidB-like acyl-CoA dehydrogenase